MALTINDSEPLSWEARAQTAEAEAEDLRRRLDQVSCASRDLFFTQALGGGHFQSRKELLAAGQTVDVTFPYGYFIVLAAKLETWGELFTQGQMDFRDLWFILRNVLENSFPGKASAAEVQGRMTAILNLEPLPETGLRGIVQDARHALEVLEAEFGLTVTVAISRVYQDPMDLWKAAEDTEHILEYLQLMGEDRPITTYEELTHRHIAQSSTSFLDLETRLLGCVRSADFSSMRLVLHELINNEFSETRPTVDTFRFRLYGVVNTLLYLVSDIRDVVGDEVIHAIDPGPRLTSARTLEEIVTVMDDIMDSLEQHTARKRQPGAPDWVAQVYAFAQENYRDPNLTVSYIADRFGMTPTYCSKIFKEQYHMRLFDLIQLKRLEEAKALMATNKSLKDIAEEAGFSSALTMSRAFKRYEGAAPNKIREQQKR